MYSHNLVHLLGGDESTLVPFILSYTCLMYVHIKKYKHKVSLKAFYPSISPSIFILCKSLLPYIGCIEICTKFQVDLGLV